MIAVIDYGSGNLRSVAKALEAVVEGSEQVLIVREPAQVVQASRLVLPGVGAFADCRQTLESTGLMEAVLRHLEAGRPFLGICVGMQLLFTQSHEFGVHPGLGWIPGQVVSFDRRVPDPGDVGRTLKVPHMGWNRVRQESAHPLWAGIPDEAFFYFVHSFHGVADDRSQVTGSAEYGIRFTAAVGRDHLFGTQFHPEKSQQHGLRLLHNFVTLC